MFAFIKKKMDTNFKSFIFSHVIFKEKQFLSYTQKHKTMGNGSQARVTSTEIWKEKTKRMIRCNKEQQGCCIVPWDAV